jgi:Arc/MetJ family transcription regulator
MRTTIDVDDEVMQELRRRSREEGVPLRRIVNAALRAAVERPGKAPARRRYRCPTYSMGQPRVPSLDRALATAADLETEEIVRKMKLRK